MKDANGPRTIVELMARFPDKAACVAFLRKLRAEARLARAVAPRFRSGAQECPSLPMPLLQP
jgi:hypothetical protein